MVTRWSLAFLGLLALAGTAAACEGLSPGDQLDAPGVICTLGFLVANPDGLYFTTAGHCIHVDDVAGSPDIGEWGTAVFHYLDPETGSESDGSPGNDFAIIKVAPLFYDQLNPKMCGWDGPTGYYNDSTGEGGGVRWYGHGVVMGDVSPKREGVALARSADSFYWIGTGVPGDSGGAVIAADGRALGVLTHLVVGVGGTNGGTTLERGFELAAQEGLTGFRLVLSGEDPLQVLQQLQNSSPTAPAKDTSATSGNTNSTKPANNATNASKSPTPANGSDQGTGGVTKEDSIAPAATNADAPTKPVPAPGIGVFIAVSIALALALAPGPRRKA
jgi:hypothetical protein